MLRTSHRRNPIFKLIGLALPIASFTLSYWGFQELRSRPLLSDEPVVPAEQTQTTTPESKGKTTPALSPSWKMNGAPKGEEFHQSMRLFLKGSDFREMREAPPQLKWGRCLAVLTVLYASFFGALALFRQSIRELRLRGFLGIRSKPCALVFNLPEHLLSLIPELTATHCKSRCWYGRTKKPVVVVLPDTSSVVAKACQRAGLWVIESTLHEDDFLSLTGIKASTNVYIFGDDSATNLELALRCQKEMAESADEVTDRKEDPPIVNVQVEDPDVRYAYQTRAIGSHLAQKVSVVPFSIPENAARLCLDGGKLTSLPRPAESKGTNLTEPLTLQPDTTHILCGEGRWLRAFLAELIKGSAIDLQIKPSIHVVCFDAENLKDKFETEVPAHSELHCHLSFHSVPNNQPESFIKKTAEILDAKTPSAPLNLFSLLKEDGDNMSLASRLCSLIAKKDPSLALAQRTRIHFLARLVERLGKEFTEQQIATGPYLIPIGAYSQSASVQTIGRAPLRDLASFISGKYDENSKGKRELWHRIHNGLPKLNSLIGVKREQNFAQADHLDIKLSKLGLPPAEHCSLEEVKNRIEKLRKEDPDLSANSGTLYELAELEHLRWTQVHLLAGFEYAANPGDHQRHPDDYRLHDCVIPFADENFDRSTIIYDKEAVLILPELVELKKGLNPTSPL